MLLFCFGHQKALYNQESETYDPGVWLPGRYKHYDREYRQCDSRNEPMLVPDRLIEMGNDHTADPVQDRDTDDHDKNDLHPRTDPGQAEQGYRFGRAGPIPKGGDKEQYGQKDIQCVTYERDILADEFLLIVFCHSDYFV